MPRNKYAGTVQGCIGWRASVLGLVKPVLQYVLTCNELATALQLKLELGCSLQLARHVVNRVVSRLRWCFQVKAVIGKRQNYTVTLFPFAVTETP